MFDMVMFDFPTERVLKEKKNLNFCRLNVNHGAENLDEEDGNTCTGRYSVRKELLLEYLKNDSERVCSATRRAKQDVWLACISALLNPDSGKKYECFIQNSEDRFLITEKFCFDSAGITVLRF